MNFSDVMEKRVVVGSLYPTGFEKFTETCTKCKRKIYLSDDWTDIKLKEFICTECFTESYDEKSKVLIDKRTQDNFNRIMGTDFTKKELKMILKQITDKKPTAA